MRQSRIAGTGRFVPPNVLDSDQMAVFAGQPRGWNGEKIRRMTGIRERRFAVPLNTNTGLPLNPERDLGLVEIEMAVTAARRALDDSGYEPEDVDTLIYVSCTAPHGGRAHFSANAHLIHKELGVSHEADVYEMDAGCGGAVSAIGLATKLIGSEANNVVLIVASNQPSRYMDRELYKETGAWLSSLIFGDGAAATVIDGKANGSGILGCVTETFSSLELMQLLEGETSRNRAYHILGKEVKEAFGTCLGGILGKLFAKVPEARGAKMFIFHQVNERVLSTFVDDYGLPKERVPMHVATRGNIAAAATLDILDEQRKSGKLKEGDLIVIGAVGAGAQVGALAARL